MQNLLLTLPSHVVFFCVCVFIREFLKDLVKHRVTRKGQSFEAEGLPLAN